MGSGGGRVVQWIKKKIDSIISRCSQPTSKVSILKMKQQLHDKLNIRRTRKKIRAPDGIFRVLLIFNLSCSCFIFLFSLENAFIVFPFKTFLILTINGHITGNLNFFILISYNSNDVRMSCFI